MDKDQLHAQRYSVLGQLWTHHNETQLQWPVVAIGVVLIGLGALLSSSGGNDIIKAISSWGAIRFPIIGMFFLLAGLVTLLMVRTMRRAREIMRKAAHEIDEYDSTLGLPAERCFTYLNRPTQGISAPLLLGLVLILMATLTGIAGCFLCFGRLYGTAGSALFCLMSFYQAGAAMKTYLKAPQPIPQQSIQTAEAAKH